MEERALHSFVILRRPGWPSEEALRATAEASKAEAARMGDIRWVRSYVLAEENGTLGTICIYEASSPEKIREHAARVGMPADEISVVADTVIVRPDPVAVAA